MAQAIHANIGTTNQKPVKPTTAAGTAAAADLSTQAGINEKLAIKEARENIDNDPVEGQGNLEDFPTITDGIVNRNPVTPVTDKKEPVTDKSAYAPGGSSAPTKPETTAPTEPEVDPNVAALEARQNLYATLAGDQEKAELADVDYYDKTPMVDMLNQQIDAAQQQNELRIDRAVDQGALELQRALQDAESQFQTQQDQITANELNSLDNAALYAEARGDKGGIGQAQYNSIQNNAAQNRVAVSQAQTKMATDTTRQIADLRAQGEFDKADALLDLTQTKLAELRAIEEYATSYNFNVDQLNTAINQWEYEFNQSAQQYLANLEMSLAEMTGMWNDGTPTFAAQMQTDEALANMALQMINSGVDVSKLSPEQKAALQRLYGMDDTGISALASAVKPASRGGGGGGGSQYPPAGNQTGYNLFLQQMADDAMNGASAEEINSHVIHAVDRGWVSVEEARGEWVVTS